MASSIRKQLPEAALKGITEANARLVRRLATTPPARTDFDITSRTQAAVAVILYESDHVWDGDVSGKGKSPASDPSLRLPTPQLQVLMTTRALNLRSHPGQASLPGGKADHTDGCVERTALRESEEEIGLAQSKLGTTLFWVHTGTPFISKTCLLVHPVIFLLIDPEETLPSLVPCPTEVSAMWSFPLELFLSSCIPAEYSNIPLSDPTTVDTHRAPQEVFRTYSDVPWINSEPYRLHRFRTHRQLIKGLSADILIAAAMRTYGRAAAYTLYAPGQPPWQAWVDYIVAGDRSTRVTRWGDGESGDMLTSAHAYATAVGVDDAVPQQAVTANDTAAPRSEDLVNGTEIAIVESS